jgi:hypothetical protein
MDTSGNIIFDYEVTGSAVSSIDTGAILNGDVDGWYTIICRRVYNATGSAYLQFNGDGGGNYGDRGIRGTNTTVANASDTAQIGVYTTYSGLVAGECDFSVHTLYAKSGAVRLVNSVLAQKIATTTVTSIIPIGQVWNNSADNITSIKWIADTANGLGVGSRIIILRGNALAVNSSPSQVGAWKRVGSTVLTGTATSVTFSGLTGNTAGVYLLSGQAKFAQNSCAVTTAINNDTTASNYGRQYLNGTNTTVAAARSTNTNDNWMAGGTNQYCGATQLIFAKSGFIRPMISQQANTISTTTVTQIQITGTSWNNTADEITSLVINCSQANGFAAGTQFDLYALYA